MLDISIMVRTTLNLDPGVLRELKRRAKKKNRPLGDIASEELARAFSGPSDAAAWPPPGWVVKEMGPCPVDLSDARSLWEFLDRETYDLSP